MSISDNGHFLATPFQNNKNLCNNPTILFETRSRTHISYAKKRRNVLKQQKKIWRYIHRNYNLIQETTGRKNGKHQQHAPEISFSTLVA